MEALTITECRKHLASFQKAMFKVSVMSHQGKQVNFQASLNNAKFFYMFACHVQLALGSWYLLKMLLLFFGSNFK